jgi:hypothetical protein
MENRVKNVAENYDVGMYSPLGNNCSDFVIDVLNEAGVMTGNTSLTGEILPNGHGNSPFSVAGADVDQTIVQ